MLYKPGASWRIVNSGTWRWGRLAKPGFARMSAGGLIATAALALLQFLQEFAVEFFGFGIGAAVAGAGFVTVVVLNRVRRPARAGPPEVAPGSAHVYRGRLRTAWRDGMLTRERRIALLRLQRRLGLTDVAAAVIEQEVLWSSGPHHGPPTLGAPEPRSTWRRGNAHGGGTKRAQVRDPRLKLAARTDSQ